MWKPAGQVQLGIFLVLNCLAVAAFATTPAQREKARLEQLREQRSQLEHKIEQTESTRSATASQLRDLEKDISLVTRKLRDLGEERAAARAELARHERDLQQLENQIANRQAQLARLLRHQFRPRENDAVAELLAGGDPNASARDRHFMGLLSRAKAELIAEIRRDAAAGRKLAGEVQQRNEQLAELLKREEQERTGLRQRQHERQAVLAKLGKELQAQRRELGTIKQNEQRLANVIDSIIRKAEAKKAAAPKSKAPASPAKTASTGKTAKPMGSTQTLTREPSGASGQFAKLRGRLPAPVAGKLAGRFGARRNDGQSVWKGLFFRAAEGADVRAVASGVVVFADWLRGYGNLLIIDHDDDFLSVYGNNQSLLADVGQKVGAGATVATVGSGAGGEGGQPESGLYFELRHRGQAFDPGKWLGMP